MLVLVLALALSQQPTHSVECRFSNPSYSGLCTVTESVPKAQPPRSACSKVLSCLNDPRCTRSYCSGTEIRGGWQLVSSGGADEPQR